MPLQNVDTTALSNLIGAFRLLQSKDTVSPESLGTLLQSIADLISSAPSLASAQQLDDWAEALKSARTAIHSFIQGNPDPNCLNINFSSVNLGSGQTSGSPLPVIIRQATTERAGVMRAEHVSELYAATRNVTALQSALADANAVIERIQAQIDVKNSPRFSIVVENKRLRVIGAKALLEAGYVPYLFRCLRKQNRYRMAGRTEEEIQAHRRPPVRKGWALYGSMYALKIEDDTLMFSEAVNTNLGADNRLLPYSPKPEALVRVVTDDDGLPYIQWGKSRLRAFYHTNNLSRSLKLKFAIGFGLPITPGRRRITPADLVTDLVQFRVILDPGHPGSVNFTWAFSHP